jgi:hypothetical protein
MSIELIVSGLLALLGAVMLAPVINELDRKYRKGNDDE